MKTLYVHIGRGKTGTTLIQSRLSQNRQTLLDHGIDFIRAGDNGKGWGHQTLAKSFIAAPPAHMTMPANPSAIRQRTADEIRASTAQTLILSSENFTMADVGEVGAFLGDLGPGIRIRIVYFVRSQDEVAESEYNQMVKLKRVTSPFAAYAHEQLEECDYFTQARRWEQVFGHDNMVCRIYDGAAGNVLEQFCACIPGLDPAWLGATRPAGDEAAANASLGMRALTAVRLLNPLEDDVRKPLVSAVVAHLGSGDLPALFFDSAEARRFRARFADENRAFCRHYLGEDRDDLGGRRYSDEERDEIRRRIVALRLATY